MPSAHDEEPRALAEEKSAWLAALVGSADDAIMSKTLDGIVTSWNLAAERMFGYRADEAIGRPIAFIVPPDRMNEEADILRRLGRGETIRHFETERVRRDGSRVPISLTVSPIQDAQGRIVGASKIARDITERRAAEAKLAAHVRALEVLYRLADLVGRARRIDDVAEAAVDAIQHGSGADRASVLVADDHGVMRFKAWRGLSDGYRAAVDGHSPWSRDTRDPAPILVADVLTEPGLGPLRDVVISEGIRALGFIPLVHRGRLLGKFMVYYDTPHAFSVDELRLAATVAHHVSFGLARAQAEQAIEQLLHRERSARQEADDARAEAELANQAKDEFLAMLAHELRNPLSVIVNATAVLGADVPLPETERARGIIRRQTRHLARMLDDLLDVARITRGRIELDRDRVDLRTTMEQAVEAQHRQVDAKRQLLTLSLPDQPVTVVGDAVRLQQVIGNLLNNASKYTRVGGTIAATVEAGADTALVRVRDDGVGIAPDKLESIFDLFSQATPSLARTEGGLGIGLTLVKRLVELHGGSVCAHSEGLGRGAEFVVQLALAAPATVAAPAALPPAAGTPRRILVVEDHDDGREMLATTLRLSGHAVFQAANGRDGVELAARESPDVVLIDIGLPDIDGYQVAHEMRRKLGQQVRLVALTGYGQPQDRVRSAAVGFDAHLVKPVDPPKLGEVIGSLG